MTLVWVLVGGAVGAPLRYLTDLVVRSRRVSVFPWGTFTVNAVGSLVLGAVAGFSAAHAASSWVLPLLGTGFCGALTTFSTFSYETIRLVEEGSILQASLNVVASLGLGFAALATGWAIAGAW